MISEASIQPKSKPNQIHRNKWTFIWKRNFFFHCRQYSVCSGNSTQMLFTKRFEQRLKQNNSINGTKMCVCTWHFLNSMVYKWHAGQEHVIRINFVKLSSLHLLAFDLLRYKHNDKTSHTINTFLREYRSSLSLNIGTNIGS